MHRVLALLLAAAAIVSAQNTSRVYQSAERPKALALIGDRYHSPVHIRDGISPALLRENIPVVFIENHAALTAAALKPFDLLILFKDGMVWPNGHDQPHVKWMTGEQQQAIWDFVHAGGAFLALHNSHGIYPPGGALLQAFRRRLRRPPSAGRLHDSRRRQIAPITQGVEDYEIFDEQHTSKYSLDARHLLLRNIARDNTAAPAGWWREPGEGRFAYLSPGHTPEGLGHGMTQRLIRNALRWLLRLDD